MTTIQAILLRSTATNQQAVNAIAYASHLKNQTIHKNVISKKWNSSRARFNDRYGTKGMIN